MINIQTQTFYERHTGEKHEVTIDFGWINPVSNGHYEVRVDDEFYATAEHKAQAFDEVVDIIRTNNWTPICPI